MPSRWALAGMVVHGSRSFNIPSAQLIFFTNIFKKNVIHRYMSVHSKFLFIVQVSRVISIMSQATVLKQVEHISCFAWPANANFKYLTLVTFLYVRDAVGTRNKIH